MFILLWLLFGGIIGWVASLLTNNNQRMGIIANIVIGLIGSLIGGLITSWAGWGGINVFTWQGTLFSILGAFILLTIINLLTRRRV